MWFSAKHYQVSRTDRPMSVPGQSHRFGGRRATSGLPLTTDVLVDFDTGQDLPEIQEAEKLLKHKHYASQPFS
jgi:hypothetical protein